MRTLWVGTYPPAGIGTPAGRGEGIYRVALDPATGALGEPVRVVETPAPSFVVLRGDVLYATDESDAGAVAALRVHDDLLEPLGTAPSGGTYPCHLLADDGWLYVANYGDGALGALRLAPDGSLVADEPPVVLTHAGSGPHAERQGGPHAHFVALAPGEHLLVVDLGTDQIRRYARTPAGPVPAGIAAAFPPGTGPRHLAFAQLPGGPATGGSRGVPGGEWWAYVSGELDPTVHALSWDPTTDTGTVTQTLPALPTLSPLPTLPTTTPRRTRQFGAIPAVPAAGLDTNCRARREGGAGGEGGERGAGGAGGEGERAGGGLRGDLRAVWAAAEGEASPSHLALDGDELVLAVRGAGMLARFVVRPGGLVDRRADQLLPASTPRHFAVVDGWTVVAEQVPGAITVLDREGTVVSSVPVPSAASVAPGNVAPGNVAPASSAPVEPEAATPAR